MNYRGDYDGNVIKTCKNSDVGDIFIKCDSGVVGWISGCVHIQCAKWCILECTDWKCRADESASDGRKLDACTALSVPGACVCIWCIRGRTDWTYIQECEKDPLAADRCFDGDIDITGGWFYAAEVQHGGDDACIVCLCDAGTDVPEGKWLWLCEHDVYRKLKKRNREPVRLYPGAPEGGTSQGTALLRNHIDLCSRCRCRRNLLDADRRACNLDILCPAACRMPAYD